MEKETNIMPKFDLFPRLTKIANVLGAFYLGREIKNTGGGPMLDEMETYNEEQLRLWNETDIYE